MPTKLQVLAFMRNGISGVVAAICGFLVAAHFVSQTDANTISTSVVQISSSLATIATAVAALTPIVMGYFAARSAAPAAQRASVAAQPEVKEIQMVTKALADKEPAQNIVGPKL